MSQGFNPEQLKRIALAKRLERDSGTTVVETEPLPDQAIVDKHLVEMDGYVVAAADEGDLSFPYKFPIDATSKLVNEVAIQFKKKHPRLMVIVQPIGEEKSITISWDGMNHV